MINKRFTIPQLRQIKEYLERPAIDRLLIFYGIPEMYNGLSNIDEIVDSIANSYDVVVFGDGLQRASSQFNANTVLIVKKLRNQGVRVFGYVSLAAPWRLSTPGDLTILKSDVDDWKTTGASDIFLDEAGFDYGVPRSGQNEVLAYIHSKDMGACLNAWQFQDVICSDIAETGWVSTDAEYQNFLAMNPNNLSHALDKNRDSYLFESFCLSELDIGTEKDTQSKASKILSLNTIGLYVMAVSRIAGANLATGEFVPDTSYTHKSESELLEYIQTNALVFGINALGFSDSGFGSDTSYALGWRQSTKFSNLRNTKSKYSEANIIGPVRDLTGVNEASTLTNIYSRDFGIEKLSVLISVDGSSGHRIDSEKTAELRTTRKTTPVKPQNYSGVYSDIHYLDEILTGYVTLSGLDGSEIPVFGNDVKTELSFSEGDCDVFLTGNKAVVSTGIEATVTISNSGTQTPSSTANSVPFGYTRYSSGTGVSSVYLSTDSNTPRWNSLSKYSFFSYRADFALSQVNKTSNLRLEIGVASTGIVNSGLDTRPYGSIWLKVASGVFTICMKGNTSVRSVSTGKTATVGEYRFEIAKLDRRGLVIARLLNKTTLVESFVVFDITNDAELVPSSGSRYLWPVFGISNLGTPTAAVSVDIRKIVVYSKLR